MADTMLYEILGISKERADEIAKIVRKSFSESSGPAEWIGRLGKEFAIDPEKAEIFAYGWFAGKYAGVSEVFNVVQKEMDKLERDKMDRADKESKYRPPNGYA